MDNLMNKFFGPLSKDYCMYFYLLSVFYGISCLLGVIGIIAMAVKYRHNVSHKKIAIALASCISLFIGYFNFRLMNTMCQRSLI